MNSYISFLRKGEEEAQQANSSDGESGGADAETPTQDDSRPYDGDVSGTVSSESSRKSNTPKLDSGIALVCISGGGEFETVRTWCDAVTKVRVAWTHCNRVARFS